MFLSNFVASGRSFGLNCLSISSSGQSNALNNELAWSATIRRPGTIDWGRGGGRGVGRV